MARGTDVAVAHPPCVVMASRRIVLGAIGVLLFLAAWELAGRQLGDALLAPPSTVLPALVAALLNGPALTELGLSLGQMFIGYLLAFAIGVPVGVLMARSRIVDAIVHPWLSMFLVTSIAALAPLLVICLGFNMTFRVAVVFLTAVWYIMLTMFQAARGLDQHYLDVARSFMASGWHAFTKVMLPALLPNVLVAARIGLTHSIRGMIVAELFITYGFGQLLSQASYDMSTAPGLALLLLLMIASMVADTALTLAARWLAPWSAHTAQARAG